MKTRHLIYAAMISVLTGLASAASAHAAALPDCKIVLKAGIQEKGCILRTKQVISPEDAAAMKAAATEPSAALTAPAVTPQGAVIVPPPKGTQPLGVMKETITRQQAAQITATMIQGREQMDIDREVAAARAELAVRASQPVNKQPQQAVTLQEVERSFGSYRESVCKVSANYDQCFADLTNAHVKRLNDFYAQTKK